jgi:hypothetical protein
MNIPPFLEKLLLSNEAVFKNASLGLSGENMVIVPPGKSAVILEVSIEPFVNAPFSPTDVLLKSVLQDGYSRSDTEDFANEISKRTTFQLQIINDTYSTNFSFNNQFSINTFGHNAGDTDKGLCWNFDRFREELFIYADRSLYFNIIYNIVDDGGTIYSGIVYTYSTPNLAFSPLIQPLPETPVTFNNAPGIELPTSITTNLTGPDVYYPFGNQYLAGTPGSNLPASEYLKFTPFSSGTALNLNSICYAGATGSAMDFWEFKSLPLINVKYALLNKRPADYGLTLPGK